MLIHLSRILVISLTLTTIVSLVFNSNLSDSDKDILFSKPLSISIEGMDRSYITNSIENPKELIIAIHGYNSSSKSFAYRSGIHNAVDDETLVVYPQSKNSLNPLDIPSWNADFCCDPALRNLNKDTEFILSLIENFQSEFNILPSNTSLIGFSNGGFLALKIASIYPDLIHSVIGASSTMGADEYTLNPIKPVNVLLTHATNDYFVDYAGEADRIKLNWLSHQQSIDIWKETNNCNEDCEKKIESIIHEGGHNIEDYRLFNIGKHIPSGTKKMIEFINSNK